LHAVFPTVDIYRAWSERNETQAIAVNSAPGRSVECPAARLPCHLDDTRRIPSARKIESVSFGMYVGSWPVATYCSATPSLVANGRIAEVEAQPSIAQGDAFDPDILAHHAEHSAPLAWL
jgi:hypothetical protein